MNKVENYLAAHARPPQEIELDLHRVRLVRRRMGMRLSLRMPLLTVGGTNGKGSVCAMLEAFLLAGGWRVGCYTSPHLQDFGERIRVGGAPAAAAEMLAALQEVSRAAAAEIPVPLTYFELTTLAAARLFAERRCELAILEVGLGGRLDAVNIFPPTVAVITNIALDHAEYLGDTRDAVGIEKAGICRRAVPVVVGDTSPPPALLAEIKKRRAKLHLNGRDFSAVAAGRFWHYEGRKRISNLPPPALAGAHQITNAATALAALECLPADFWPGTGAIRTGLHAVSLSGRFQILPGRPVTVVDVAHNPAAAAALERGLFAMGYYPHTRAVLGMLARKDIAGFVAALGKRVDVWYTARPRGGDLSGEEIATAVIAAGGRAVSFPSIAAAVAQARADSGDGDRIVVTGSFLTVSDCLKAV